MADIRTIIAVTGEGDRYRKVREAAIDKALAEHATLILYDIEAAQSLLESPVPTGWSAEGTEEDAADRLGPEELEAAGQMPLARLVQDARERGVDAWGWLAAKSGREPLLEYAAGEPGARIMVPQGDPDLDVSELPEAEAVPSA